MLDTRNTMKQASRKIVQVQPKVDGITPYKDQYVNVVLGVNKFDEKSMKMVWDLT